MVRHSPIILIRENHPAGSNSKLTPFAEKYIIDSMIVIQLGFAGCPEFEDLLKNFR